VAQTKRPWQRGAANAAGVGFQRAALSPILQQLPSPGMARSSEAAMSDAHHLIGGGNGPFRELSAHWLARCRPATAGVGFVTGFVDLRWPAKNSVDNVAWYGDSSHAMVVAVVLALIIAGCTKVGSAPIERMNAKTAAVSAVDSDKAWVQICPADINAPNPGSINATSGSAGAKRRCSITTTAARPPSATAQRQPTVPATAPGWPRSRRSACQVGRAMPRAIAVAGSMP